MNKKFLSKITMASVIAASIILTGCGEKTTSDAKMIEKQPVIRKMKKLLLFLMK